MENRCPKCNIDLSCEDFKNIKNRNGEGLALKMIFGECSLESDIIEKGYCDLCGALGKEIMLERLD